MAEASLQNDGEALARADDARLEEAVAGIGGLVPQPPHDLLAPPLRVPMFAAFFALAVLSHGVGLTAHMLFHGVDGEAGRLAGAEGVNVIEIEIIDGQDAPEKGGHSAAAVPGSTSALAPTTVEQEQMQLSHAENAPPPIPTEAMPPEALTTASSSDTQIAASLPPPPFQIDTSAPPPTEPAEHPVDNPADAETKPESPADVPPSPAREASQASSGGDDGMAQAVEPKQGRGGRAGATPGEIRAYQARLGARIRANKPSGRGSRGYVEIAFAIEADGRLASAAVKRSSGNTMLEERALNAVRKSAPFPKPPPLMTGRQLQFSVPFTFE